MEHPYFRPEVVNFSLTGRTPSRLELPHRPSTAGAAEPVTEVCSVIEEDLKAVVIYCLRIYSL